MSPTRTLLSRVADAALEAPVAPSFSRIGYSVRSRLERWDDPTHLEGVDRRVLITGVNSGLGYAVACAVLRSGGHVVGTVRSDAKAEATRTRIADDVGNDAVDRLVLEVADLEDLASVRALADRCVRDHRFDAIVHNAGAMFAEHATTVDGLERTYQVHVVAPFLLTTLLLPSLRDGARVVTVTSGGMYAQALDVDGLTRTSDASEAERHPYRGSTAYALAKRAQVALTAEWARLMAERAPRRAGAHVTFHAVHPGWALTPGVEASLPTFRRITGPILRSPEQGADTIAWLVLAREVPGNGGLWHDRRRRTTHKVPWTRRSPSETARLWQRVARDAGVDAAVGGASVDATVATAGEIVVGSAADQDTAGAAVTRPGARPARPGRPVVQRR